METVKNDKKSNLEADFTKASNMIDDLDMDSLFHGKNIDEAWQRLEKKKPYSQ